MPLLVVSELPQRIRLRLEDEMIRACIQRTYVLSFPPGNIYISALDDRDFYFNVAVQFSQDSRSNIHVYGSPIYMGLDEYVPFKNFCWHDVVNLIVTEMAKHDRTS